MKKITCSLLLLASFQGKAQSYLQLQTYKLENGFTVYLLPDNEATSTFGAVAVNAGSKNDPSDATGLAHYLEHLLFKGTTTLGTTDYEKEKPFLDSITIYYQQLGKTKDEKQRAQIKARINNQAVQASKYGLPTEFHTLLTSIGGTAINAFTQPDMTVYHNSFPGNQMEKWLDLYAERFTNPVFRSFQSELEVVYEEKNRGSDNFSTGLLELLNKNIFPNHPYGTQSTIGTSEHLKNPPIDRIYDFFNAYYVANNMALILVGNFDPEKTIPLIKEKFSKLRTGTVPVFAMSAPAKFSENKTSTVRYSPVKISEVGFKSIPKANADEVPLEICNNLLSNDSETGLLNKLQLEGKVLAAESWPYHLHDDGAEMLIIVPKIIGQSFGKAEALVYKELAKLSSGDFSDEFLQRVKNELIKKYKTEMETSQGRGYKLFDVFNCNKDWNYIISYPKQVAKVTKQDIMQIASKYYSGYHYSIHSKTGFPHKDHLDKPGFKPVLTEQKGASVYALQFKNIQNETTVPKFLDFNSDKTTIDLGSNNKLFVVKNSYNDIATLKIKYYAGKEKIPTLDVAANIMNASSIKGTKIDEFKQQLSALNCTILFGADDDFFTIEISGDEKNITSALILANKLIKDPEPSPAAKKNMEEGIASGYKFEKKDPATMGNVLYNYALYGDNSEFKKRPSLSAVKELKTEDILKVVKDATSYAASFHYCGNVPAEAVANDIKQHYSLSDKGTPSITYQAPKVLDKTTIYIVDDKTARQNQIFFSVLGNTYNTADDAKLSLLSQYYGGSFSGLITQEIREYRSLAYATAGGLRRPTDIKKPLRFNGFVGCQADKTNESIDVMMKLLSDLPKYPERIDPFKTYVESSISTNYPLARERSQTIEKLQLQGYPNDPKMNEYNQIKNTSFDDMYKSYEQNIKGKPVLITIYGDKSKVDLEKLKKYGEVVELQKEQIATY